MLKVNDFMKLAYKEALKVKGFTSPNPAVGAIIYKNGKMIARGATGKPGEPHAEIDALKKCGKDARGATMFVTLEPCCIYGRTPPCTKAIIEAGISAVYIGTKDPNPRISGMGIRELEKAGVQTQTGFLTEPLIELNADFFKYIQTGMPFVAAKFAQTLDGRIAADTGDSKWITGEKSRHYTHWLRGIYDAILVGSQTVIADNPQLNVRGHKLPEPVRVILDPEGIIPFTSNVLTDNGKTIIATTKKASEAFISFIQNQPNKFVLFFDDENGAPDLRLLLSQLALKEITSVLVEGGQRTLTAFFENNLVDKVYAFISPQILLSGLNSIQGKPTSSIADSIKLKMVKQKKFSDDVLITGYIHLPDECIIR